MAFLMFFFHGIKPMEIPLIFDFIVIGSGRFDQRLVHMYGWLSKVTIVMQIGRAHV